MDKEEVVNFLRELSELYNKYAFDIENSGKEGNFVVPLEGKKTFIVTSYELTACSGGLSPFRVITVKEV